MKEKNVQPARVSDQLRHAIATADISQYELARRVGLDKSVLSRFMHNKSGLSVRNIDLIAEVLELELRKRRTRATEG